MSHSSKQLFAKHADGTITPAEARELENRMLDDASLRKDFLEYMNVCVALEDNSAFQNFAANSSCRHRRGARSRSKIVAFSAWTLAAAASIALGLMLFLTSEPTDFATVPALVLRNDEAVLDGSKSALSIGDRIRLGELDLKEGWLRLELPKGVVFDIYGPAKGRFETPERFRLASGRLNVDVGELGKGFTVLTESADIVDLGTSFGVDVDQNSRARVAVFSGEVEVHSRTPQDGPRLLEEGEGLQFEPTGISSRLVSINIANEVAPHRLLPSQLNHFDIRDNLPSDKSLRYYGIVSNGMQEGANPYTSQKRVRWTADNDQPFPPELIGADLIQTFHNDRTEVDLAIELQVKQDSELYILFDERYATPQWLSDMFTNTGKVVRSGPWKPVGLVHDIVPDPEGNFYIRYNVWKSRVDANQIVPLGESVDPNAKGVQRAMYGIAIKPAGMITPSETIANAW